MAGPKKPSSEHISHVDEHNRGRTSVYSFQCQQNQTCRVAPDTLFSTAEVQQNGGAFIYRRPRRPVRETARAMIPPSKLSGVISNHTAPRDKKTRFPRPVAINQVQYSHPQKNMSARDASPALAPPPLVLTHEATSAQVEINRGTQQEEKKCTPTSVARPRHALLGRQLKRKGSRQGAPWALQRLRTSGAHAGLGRGVPRGSPPRPARKREAALHTSA